MKATLTPHILLLASLAGWLNREHQQVLDYMREENRIRKEQLGRKRLRLTDDQRRRLAAKGWEIGRRLLGEYATIVAPDSVRGHPRSLASIRNKRMLATRRLRMASRPDPARE